MLVALKVDDGTAKDLRGPLANHASQTIAKLAEQFSGELAPMHPTVRNPLLDRFFQVTVESQELAQQLAEQLNKVESVESAYVKPGDEPA